MHYLKTYPESIGISHYLCWRMKHMRAEEVEFYWPQIWSVHGPDVTLLQRRETNPAYLVATC